MLPASTEHATTEQLAASADELRRLCRELAASLADLDVPPSAQLEGPIGRHLAQARVLRGAIGDSLAVLAAATEGTEQLPPGLQGQVASRMLEAARLLQTAERAYGRLAGAVMDAMLQVRRELGQVQQGGRMLRAYAQGARIAG